MKTDILKSYFDMTFQTETTAVHGVCFLSDKHKRLRKFSKESTSCVITNIVRNKETEFWLTNFSIIKPERVVFAKKRRTHNQFDWANHKLDWTNGICKCKLQEQVARDNGESFINIPILAELVDKVDIDMTYSFFNHQVVTYNNQKKLRSTTLTTTNEQQNTLSQINISSTDLLSSKETKEMAFDNIDDESLIHQLVCTKCNPSIPNTTQKIVKCIATPCS